MLDNINDRQSILAKATIDESGVCNSLIVQVENPAMLLDSHQSTNKMSQVQGSQKTSPKVSRKTGKSFSPRKELNSQKILFTRSSQGGANLLV